jgi:heat-inducible transcriptional repressor
MGLDKRAQILLKALITHHISDGNPVASKTLCTTSKLDLSSASIRNIMKDLEEAGFIVSPHTSSGRVPTQKGYRFFVDSLVTIKSLNDSEILSLKNNLTLSDNKDLINSAADCLSHLSKFAGVVMIPRTKKIVFKHIEFLYLSKNKILVIIVTTDGTVQNRVLTTEEDYDQATLIESTNYFNQNYTGCNIEELKAKLISELKTMKKKMTTLMSAAIETSSSHNQDADLVMAGQHNLLDNAELSQNVSSIRKVIEIFEQKSTLLKLLEKSNRADGMQIFIGEESGYQALDECSIITAPYKSDGEILGMLGVIGPTRMAYERVIPIVDITAKLLGRSIK